MLRFWMASLSLTWAASALAATPDITATAPAEAPPAWASDPNCWRFEGNTSFDTAEIRRELATDFDIAFEMRAAKDPYALIQTLAAKTLLGYHRAGFAEAMVRIEPSADNAALVGTIVEGRRCMKGRVLVLGNKQIAAGPIVARLTLPYVPDEAVSVTFYDGNDGVERIWHGKDGTALKLKDPVWEPGKPAPLDEQYLKVLEPHVKQACVDQGYPYAWCKLRVTADENADTATLFVTIDDEGSPQMIQKIFLAGNTKNTDDEVLAWLDTPRPAKWTRETRLQIEQRLWDSGRFVSYKLEPNRLGGLRIELVESNFAPRLSEPLKPEDRALLKCRTWLAHTSSWGGDLQFKAANESMSIVGAMSPAEGLVVRYQDSSPTTDAAPALDEAAVAKRQSLSLISAVQNRQLSFEPSGMQLIIPISNSLTRNKDGTQNMTLGIGAGFHTNKRADAPIDLTLQASPAVMLAYARYKNARSTIEDDILTIVNDDGLLLRIDVETGALLSMSSKSEGSTSELSFAPDACARLIGTLESESRGKPNRYAPTHRVRSIGQFLCTELERFGYEAETYNYAQLRTILKLVDDPLLTPLVRWIVSKSPDEKLRSFDIPIRYDAEILKLYGQGKYVPLAMMYVISFGDDIVPRESWPWQAAREVAAEHRNVGNRAEAQLDPCTKGELAMALLLAKYFDSKQQAQPASHWARRGLEHLDRQQFAEAVVALFDDRGLLGQFLLGAAESFRELEEHEVDTLVQGLSESDTRLVQGLWRLSRNDPDRPMPEALRAMSDEMWPLLKPLFERELRRIAAK